MIVQRPARARLPLGPLRGNIETLYLNAASLTIAAGTSAVQRNIIAGRGLGLPKN